MIHFPLNNMPKQDVISPETQGIQKPIEHPAHTFVSSLLGACVPMGTSV